MNHFDKASQLQKNIVCCKIKHMCVMFPHGI
uniref:Uncharacterized protein n=1 Tax=Anguilla anguilla TaxID=7936 RepID=A0A0E9SK99_ANGAN